MTRTAVTFLVLASLSGCFVIHHDAGEPIEAIQPAPSGTARTGTPAWRRPDGSPAQAVTSTTAGPVQTMSSRLPDKAPADGPALPDLPAARHPEQTLVRDTWTQAPGNRTPSSGPELGASGGTPAPATASRGTVADISALLPPTGCAPCTTAVASGAGTTLRLVNSRRIAFGYEVKDGSPSTPVEVWGTQDMKAWKRYEPVAHKGHGCVIEVKDEGLYGFVLRARGEPGKDAPPAGEAPQVWVAVDVTRPVVQLLAAEMNDGPKAPALVIHWSAHDKNLGLRPVTLSWAEKADGPWTAIAANVENTGRYEWTLPHGLPPAVYLRVQAADLMGNVGTAQTSHRLVLPRPGGEPLAGKEVEVTAGYEPERRPPAQPRLVTLPPTPPIEMPPAPPPAPPKPRPQVSILSVEPERN
jgi:hypothetical protein